MLNCQESLPLSPGRVDLWFASVETAVARDRIAVYRRALPADEVARADRYRQEKDRNCCLVARALVRTVLSDYSGHDPAVWTFRYNAHGKPSIAQPAGLSLEFNVSHTSGLVICGVTSAGELGVDVEHLSRAGKGDRHLLPERPFGCFAQKVPVPFCPSCLDLARRFFAAPEIAFLEQAPPERQPGLFLEFWTLKEAYIKARGLGLSMPLADFAFTLAGPQPPAAPQPPVIRFLRGGSGEAGEWRFAQFRLCGDYQAAVALRPPGGEDLSVRVQERCP
jgi:4'-phosphopantetheinyl transferase